MSCSRPSIRACRGHDMSALTGSAAVALPAVQRSPGYWSGVLRRLSRDPVAMVALAIIIAIVLMAIFAPWIAPADPSKGSMLRRLKPIGTPGYPLGADELG